MALDTHVAQDLAMYGLPRWLSPLPLQVQYALLQSDGPDGNDYLSDELRLILNHELKTTGLDL